MKRLHASTMTLVCFLTLGSAAVPPGPDPTPPEFAAYRAKFAVCDATNSFDGIKLPIRNGKGEVVWYDCSDKSLFTRFEVLPAKEGQLRAVLIVSKLAHDLDGSPSACTTPGKTDFCGTALSMRSTQRHPCPSQTPPTEPCAPVNAAEIPYVVIPASGPPGSKPGEFSQISKVVRGDYGMVIANGVRVPVIVGDTGPFNKIGEGSTALLARLSEDGRPSTIGSGVQIILFPGSHDATISPDTLALRVERRGKQLYAGLLNPPR